MRKLIRMYEAIINNILREGNPFLLWFMRPCASQSQERKFIFNRRYKLPSVRGVGRVVEKSMLLPEWSTSILYAQLRETKNWERDGAETPIAKESIFLVTIFFKSSREAPSTLLRNAQRVRSMGNIPSRIFNFHEPKKTRVKTISKFPKKEREKETYASPPFHGRFADRFFEKSLLPPEARKRAQRLYKHAKCILEGDFWKFSARLCARYKSQRKSGTSIQPRDTRDSSREIISDKGASREGRRERERVVVAPSCTNRCYWEIFRDVSFSLCGTKRKKKKKKERKEHREERKRKRHNTNKIHAHVGNVNKIIVGRFSVSEPQDQRSRAANLFGPHLYQFRNDSKQFAAYKI